MERMGQFNRRRELRREILGRLYDNWFELDGEPSVLSKEQLGEAKELKLAYRYLADKGLIRLHSVESGGYEISITIQGIDRVEMTNENE
ncbi:hypothetical protein QWJ34_06100 [Saccharibacillus sp. CPCC 101409]|uniref:hypothetical protein n=1 Tax=Saccharibacillus sp. CPCC 101409 TaxID=3058041 RepID=UPI0026728782|nr:hypothetical protein [Saccharibacillus sp. CPCC 101409]MDO3409327.1 hypothetical protein [Saccharibacillus sp. CPCC 101409]